MLHINDQRDHGDGVTAEGTELQGLIGWGETPTEAIADLNEQYAAVMQAVADASAILDTMEP